MTQAEKEAREKASEFTTHDVCNTKNAILSDRRYVEFDDPFYQYAIDAECKRCKDDKFSGNPFLIHSEFFKSEIRL